MVNVRYHESEYEEVFIQQLTEVGWSYIPGCEMADRRITDAIYEADLMAYLQAKYGDRGLTALDYQQMIANLRNTSGVNDYLTARAVHKLVCHDGYDYQPLDGSEAFKVRYIDFDADDVRTVNIFRCINQFEMVEGEENRRPDIVLMVNGIPLAVVELKNPADPEATISTAWEQICVRYRRDIPSMMKYAALTIVSDGANTRMGSQFTPEEYYYAWKKVENEDPNGRVGIDEMEMLIKGALSPVRMLEILRDYVYFADEAEASKEIEIGMPLSPVLRHKNAPRPHLPLAPFTGRQRKGRNLLRCDWMRQDAYDALPRPTTEMPLLHGDGQPNNHRHRGPYRLGRPEQQTVLQCQDLLGR